MNEASSVILLLIPLFIAQASQISNTRCRAYLGGEASRRFAYELYIQTVREKGGGENIFLAPTTVSSALGMVLLGANGTTKDILWQGLKLSSTSQNFTEDDYPCLFPQYDTNGEFLVLRTAQKLFGEKTFDFNSTFLRNTLLFGANMEEVDFANEALSSRKYINEWVSNVTEKKIPHLFGKDDINSETILAITSAIYFKGLWQKRFRESRRLPFSIGKTEIKVRFMEVEGRFRYINVRGLGARLLELPYKSSGGRDLSMIIILPYEEFAMNEIEARLSEETLTPAIKSLLYGYRPLQIRVMLPKFKINGDYDLKPLLSNMGMEDIFSPDTADLSGMRNRSSTDSRNLYVGSAVHKTFIKVNKQGTEAAGATGMLVMARSRPPSFYCNRPFITIIYDKATDRILFMGKVVNPKKN